MEFIAVLVPAVLTAGGLFAASELVRRSGRTHEDE